MKFNALRVLVVAFSSLSFVGCGGGGGQSAAPAAPVGPSPTPPATTGVVRGAITGFGSVYVGGTRYDTSSAAFTRDDDDASQSDLSVGMVIKMRAERDDNRAQRIEYDEDVKGPIDSISSDQMTVLGQTVLLSDETRVDDSFDITTAVAGDIVEVSGFRNAADAIEASYVEGKDTVDEYEVVGAVRDLDPTTRTFRIGALIVDYSTARFDDFAASNLTSGQLVEVEDENRAYSPGDLRLVATEVELESSLRMEDDDDFNRSHDDNEAEIEGLITRIIDANQFVIAGVTVRTSTQTRYEFGTPADIRVGTKVEAEGSFGADDVLEADKVQFKRNAVRLAGVVENVDAAARLLTVLGVELRIAAEARLEDDRDGTEGFQLSDIVAGDFVETRGVASDTGMTAHELDRDDSEDTRLRGPATDTNATAGTLRILGVPISTNASTRYERDDDVSMSRTEFFAALNDGQSLVDAQWSGSITDPSIAVRELELED